MVGDLGQVSVWMGFLTIPRATCWRCRVSARTAERASPAPSRARRDRRS